MTKEQLFDAIGGVEESYIRDAGENRKRSAVWVKWGALAACLVLVVSTVLWQLLPRERVPGEDSCDTGPILKWQDRTYVTAGWATAYELQLPEGWTLTGTAEIDGEMRDIYTHPDHPLWVYVHELHYSNISADDNYWVYQRYVVEELLGRHLIRYGGQLYVRMNGVRMIGEPPYDVDMSLYRQVERDYGWRFEGELPEGFAAVGDPIFTGYNTVPEVELGANETVGAVFANPDVPEVLLTSCRWFSRGNGAETQIHDGYLVFILYSGPLA